MIKVRDEAREAFYKSHRGTQMPNEVFNAGWRAALDEAAKRCGDTIAAMVESRGHGAFGVEMYEMFAAMLRDPELKWPGEE